MAKTLTDQQIVECVRKVLESLRSSQLAGDGWVPVGSIYARLFAHPEKFGAPDVYSLPKIERFTRVCKVMFETVGIGGEIMVKAPGDPR